MRWELLGGVRAIVDDDAGDGVVELHLSGKRPNDIVAVLLLNRGRSVSVEQLVDQLWPAEPPPSARNAVQRFVSDIRAGLGSERGCLVSDRSGYRVDIAAGELDVIEVEDGIRRAISNTPVLDPQVRLDLLLAGESALSKRLCAGSEDVPIVMLEAERLAQLRISAMEHAAEIASVDGFEIMLELERWQLEQPFNERLAGQLMLALAGAGRQHDALSVHRSLRERLLDELGVSPGPELDRIELSILNQEVGATSTLAARQQPAVADLLIGRDDLLNDIEQALTTARLVTLTGPGGSGKTRAAMHIAHERPARVALLSDAERPDAVVELVADALDLPARSAERALSDLKDDIVWCLANRDELLLIDNAEHLIEAVAALVDEIIGCPGRGRVLVTSREHLAISSERVLQVTPLTEDMAVELLALRAAEIGAASFDSIVHDPDARRICRGLDGLPLAVELAASQLLMFTPAELAGRIDQPIVSLGTRRGPERQRSLEELLDWSWRLLNKKEQSLLAELSLYHGWTAATVEYLEPTDGLSLLHALIAKSLVARFTVANSDPGSASTRYALLDTIRAFARTKLSGRDEADARRRHSGWILAQARSASIIDCLAYAEPMRRFDDERQNVLDALTWLHDNGPVGDFADLLARSSGSFAHGVSLLEGERWYGIGLPAVEAAHAAGQLDDDLLGAVLTGGCDVAMALGDTESAVARGLGAVELAGDQPFDWAPSVLCTVAILFELAFLNHGTEGLMVRAEKIAPLTPSAKSNTAQVAAWRGAWELMNRNYSDAADSFSRSLGLEARPGRALLLAEIGTVTVQVLCEEYEKAAATADGLKSQPDTDTWHYVVDVIAAVALAGVDPRAAAKRLEAALGPRGESDLSGRADDIRIATGVIAWHNGDIELCRRMMDLTLGRGPAQMVLLVAYSEGDPRRSLSDRAWRSRWRMIMERHYDRRHEVTDAWVTTQPGIPTIKTALGSI